MQLPVHILQVGSRKTDRLGYTRDISSGGVCFLSDEEVEIGGRIEYLITLSNGNPPVKIRCLGKVLRSRQPDETAHFEVAVTMERYQFMNPADSQPLAVAS
jgi:hypothetical protein